MNRVGSGSSASLFFGPSISPDVPTRTKKKGSASPVSALRIPHPVVKTRHSYSGIGGECKTWNTIQARAISPSPDSSPARLSFQQPRQSSVDNDEDMFFGGGLHNSSFQLCVTKGTPSPRSRRLDPGTLQRKYRPRDSGVVISDDDDYGSSLTSSSNGDHLNIVPPASMSAGSLYSDADDGLVTPGVAPESGSGWPGSAIFVRGTDDNSLRNSMDGRDAEVNVDEFIMRTLSTASKNSEGTKRAPDTPVKKQKTTFLGIDRPWQSAMAPKVGLRYQLDNRTAKAPRKSLPADFSRRLEDETDSEQEDDSPIARRDKYSGLGLGRPQPPLLREGHPARTRLLMRRTSSGAFSSGSDTASMLGTPTRTKDDGMLLTFLQTFLTRILVFQMLGEYLLHFQQAPSGHLHPGVYLLPLHRAPVLCRQRRGHVHLTVPQNDLLQELHPWHVGSLTLQAKNNEVALSATLAR